MRYTLVLSLLLLTACTTQPQSVSDAIGAGYLSIDAAAQTVSNLCRQTEPRGPCEEGALLTTAQKDDARTALLQATTALDEARTLYTLGDTENAQDRIAMARAYIRQAETLVKTHGI
jgi:hypothetical protein